MTQTANVRASIGFKRTASPDGGQAVADQELSYSAEFTNGTTSGKADLAFRDDRQLASGASEDLDFAGSLTDAFGATITAVEIVAIMIKAAAANTTNLTIGGATAEWQGPFAAAGDKIVLRPGEVFMMASDTGWAVGAGTTDDLRIANASGAAADYSIAFVARSA